MKEILKGLCITFICCITFCSLNAQDYYLKSFAKRPQIDYWLDGAKSFPKKQTKDWHATRSKKAALNAAFNFNKFKRSFPEIRTAMEYVSGAHFFKTNGPDGMLDKKMENEDHVFYDESNNICVVYAPSGLPKTMFRPKEGMIYFKGLGGDDPKYTYDGISEKYAANSVASNSGYNAMPDECFEKDRSGKYAKIDFDNTQYDDFKNSKIFIKEKARYIQVTQDADGDGVLDNMNLFYKKNGTKITPIPPGYANDGLYQSTAIFTRTSAGFKKVPRDLVMATEEYSQVGTANDPYSAFVDNSDNDSNANDTYGKVPEKPFDQYEEPDEDDAVFTKRGSQYIELTVRELKSPKFVPVPVYAEFNGKHFEVTKDANHDGYYDDFPLSILKPDGTFEPVPPGYANQYKYRDKDFYFPGMGVMLRIPKPLVMATETYAEDSVNNELPTYGDAANVRPRGNSAAQYDDPPAEVDAQNDNYDLPPAEVDPRAGQYDAPPPIPDENSDAAQYDVVPPEEKGSQGNQYEKIEMDPTKNLDYFAKAKGSQWHPIRGQDWRRVHEAQWKAYNNQFRNLKSKEEYFAVALGFLYKAPKSTLSKKMKNGHLIKYHEASNLFAVYDEKNRPITMFKPDNGIKLYYEKTGNE